MQKGKILNSILLFLSSLLFYFIVRLLSFFSTSFTWKIVFSNSLCFIGFNSNNSILQRKGKEMEIMEGKVETRRWRKNVNLHARGEESKRDFGASMAWRQDERVPTSPLASAECARHSCWLMLLIRRMKTPANVGGKKGSENLHLFITKHHPFLLLKQFATYYCFIYLLL